MFALSCSQNCTSVLFCSQLNFATIKTSTALGITAVAVIGYSLLRKTTALGTINFFPDRVRGFRFDGITPVISVGIGFQNTSNQSFTIRSLGGNIYSNGYYAGHISAFDTQTINPNSQGIIKADITLQLIGVANDIINAIENGNFQQEISLDALANIDNLQLPIKFKFKLG